MPINFTPLEFGQSYERKFLANLWGYKGHQALDRGVVTPVGTNYVILFVTKIKERTSTQYNDYIDGEMLFWEGENGHIADQRLVDAKKKGDEIHLFYRDIHHTPFVYFGKLSLFKFELKTDLPSKFDFKIDELVENELNVIKEVQEHAPEYKTLAKTEQQAIVKSRLGQGIFRYNLIKLWGSCAVTNLQNITLLRASHLKPWKDSSNDERLSPYNGLLLTPNYDLLLDKGLIAFKSNGQIVVSNRLDKFGQKVFHIDKEVKLRRSIAENKEFLEYHRDRVFK
jgi:putative restriction endonuclease